MILHLCIRNYKVHCNCICNLSSADIFRSNSVFIGDNCREAVNEGRGDFIPIFFSDMPLLFERGLKKIDVALVTVSPPDNHGYCTLSASVDISLAAVKMAKHVIGEL